MNRYRWRSVGCRCRIDVQSELRMGCWDGRCAYSTLHICANHGSGTLFKQQAHSRYLEGTYAQYEDTHHIAYF